uniref:Uncharacterized protein n=2 Tax=unclassified Polaromonas TaxID=2638319 RepID=A0A2S1FID8_9BURK|nr:MULTISPECIES: hypothetical protein [unclassified Polaromonas]AWD71966.1 hypothetical protein pE10SP1_p024 [Polaromonas sp. E10S]AWD72031.1 hypothetical protein pE19SP1_p016 [Polaromonas sp. E19S]
MRTDLIKIFFLTIITIFCIVAFSIAIAQELDKRTLDAIARHRTMALAHESAAKCLESGRNDSVCEGELQTTCAGIGVGRFCGMKHEQ